MMRRIRISVFIVVLALCAALTGSGAARAQEVAVRIVPSQAAPGSTVFLTAESLPGTATLGVSFTALLKEATAYGGPAPTFVDAMTVGDVAKDALLAGMLFPDGHYNAALAKPTPIRGAGTLLQIPITIPSAAHPGAIYQLLLSNANWVDGQNQSFPITLASGLLTVTPTTAGGGSAVILKDVPGHPGAQVDLAVGLGAVGPVGSVEFTLQIDGPPGLLKFESVQASPFAAGALLASHLQADGRLRVAIVAPKGLVGPGELFEVPLDLSLSAPVGSYIVRATDPRISDLNGNPLAVSVGNGVLTVLPTPTGAPASLEFLDPPAGVGLPVGVSVPIRLQAGDQNGAASLDPVTKLSVIGVPARAKLKGMTLVAQAPGAVVLKATFGSNQALAAYETFVPNPAEDLFAPTVYARPGDRILLPIYYLPKPFVSDPVFDLVFTSGAAADIPVLDSQPILYPAEMQREAVSYAESRGSGVIRIWSRSMAPDGPSLAWLVPIQAPMADPGAAGVADLPVRLIPVMETGAFTPALHGGTGRVRIVSPQAPPGVQVVSPVADSAYGDAVPVDLAVVAASAGLLYATAWVDSDDAHPVYLDTGSPTAVFDSRAWTEGPHTIHVAAIDHLNQRTDSAIPIKTHRGIGVTKGDLNGDGVVDIRDASISLQIAVKLVHPSPQQVIAGDMNGDGALNLKDTVLILEEVVGL